MKIAINVSPLSDLNRDRGIGSYTRLVIEGLKGKTNVQVQEFTGNEPKNAAIIHYPFFDLFFRTLSGVHFAKTVVTIHDVIPLIFPNKFPIGIRSKLNLFAQKRALKKVSRIICDSKSSKRDVISYLKVEETKVDVVYLAPGKEFKKIDDQVFLNKVKNKYKFPKSFVLYVGDVNWNKNVPNLIEAMNNVESTLILIGKAFTDNSLAEVIEIQKIIAKNKLGKKVKILGFVSNEELVAVYNLATVTAQPSFYEGFGLPTLESMACGTPVVCSDNSSLSEIAKDVGIFTNPNNPTDIANKIKSCLSKNVREYSKLSYECVKHASKFTVDKTINETINVYEKTIQSN